MSAKSTTKAAAKKTGAKAKGASKTAKKTTKSKNKTTKTTRKTAAKRGAKGAKKARGRKGANSVDRRSLFVQEYLVDLNATQAAIRAGYSPASARQTAAELLALPEIRTPVADAMKERAERTGITQDAVLHRLWDVATADPRELVEVQRGCCRYCWGADHHYQWTPQELRQAKQRYLLDLEDKESPVPADLDEAGGVGFNPKRDPNPDCPECFGDGDVRVLPKDTRDLSPAARLLYAGVKTSRDGIEVKMHDQTGMLVNVGKHLGMFAKKVDLKGEVKHRDQTLEALLDEIDGADTGLPGDGG